MVEPTIELTVMMEFSDVPIYLHRCPVDFRKAINGLSQIVNNAMGTVFLTELCIYSAIAKMGTSIINGLKLLKDIN